jgi:hypothetical protein
VSVLVASIVNGAALRVGDPNFRRVTREDWLEFYNEVVEGIASRMRVIPYYGYFKIVAGQPLYALPARLVVLTNVGFSATPAVADSYRKLTEKFNDEFESLTNISYPTGEPMHYHARPRHFYLISKPTVDVVRGGKVSGYQVPVPARNIDSEYLPLPDWFKNHVRNGMLVPAKRKLEKYDEAAADEATWLDQDAKLAENMEDPSHDRRAALRPSGWDSRYSGQA